MRGKPRNPFESPKIEPKKQENSLDKNIEGNINSIVTKLQPLVKELGDRKKQGYNALVDTSYLTEIKDGLESLSLESIGLFAQTILTAFKEQPPAKGLSDDLKSIDRLIASVKSTNLFVDRLLEDETVAGDKEPFRLLSANLANIQKMLQNRYDKLDDYFSVKF